MSVSYFCNDCENEDNFTINGSILVCGNCQSRDIEITKDDGPPYADEINEDIFYEDLDSLYE